MANSLSSRHVCHITLYAPFWPLNVYGYVEFADIFFVKTLTTAGLAFGLSLCFTFPVIFPDSSGNNRRCHLVFAVMTWTSALSEVLKRQPRISTLRLASVRAKYRQYTGTFDVHFSSASFSYALKHYHFKKCNDSFRDLAYWQTRE